MQAIKAYKPMSSSISSGQVLKEPYSFAKARTIVSEMVDGLALDLVSKRLKTDQIVLHVSYDRECADRFDGELVADHYGRTVPKPAHGTANLGRYSSSTSHILEAVTALYDRIVERHLTVRRINLCANHLMSDEYDAEHVQQSLFDNAIDDSKERKIQESILKIKSRFGKNSILKGVNFEEGATAIERNGQIGGHKA